MNVATTRTEYKSARRRTDITPINDGVSNSGDTICSIETIAVGTNVA